MDGSLCSSDSRSTRTGKQSSGRTGLKMAPRIQYAKTSDGVNIAYWTMGEGEPSIVQVVGMWSHVQREWEVAERRAWFERLARNHKIVKFDQRGSGLSDRDVEDLSVEAMVRDVEAVVEDAALDRIALFGATAGVRTCLLFAAERSEPVTNIVLWTPGHLGGERRPVVKALDALRDADWELYTDALVLSVQGWSHGDLSKRIGEMFRESTTPENSRAVDRATEDFDIQPFLPRLRAPALLLYRPSSRAFRENLVRHAASVIPDAGTMFLEGDSYSWYDGDIDAVVEAIEGFIAGDEPRSPSETSTGVFRTILFTDIESSTPLTQRLGDAGAQEVLRKHNSIVRDAVNQSGGSEIKHTGDGIMASFPSASGAVQAAVAIQQGFARHNEEDPDTALRVRIGLNAGEPVAEAHPDGQSDLFGTSVILAARIAAKAEGGEILVSDVVRQLVAGKQFMFNDRGETELRGFEDPVRVYEVRWESSE